MLLEHNYPVYQAMEDMLAENNKAILVTATGTGKSYVALEYLERHDLRALVICPKHVICTAWEKLTDRVDTLTYHKFSKLSKIPEYDCYIFDEAHHAGSKVWGKAVKDFMGTCAAPVIGLTADSKRYSDGGKDVAEELWDDCVVHGYDQAEAVEEGVLPDATYICTLFGIEERIRELGQQAIDPALWARLDYTLKNCGTMEDILKRHMPAGLRKGIIFVDSISETETAREFIFGVYPGVTAEILHHRMTKQEKADVVSQFEEGDSGYLIAVDMLNEGLHVNGVNTVIMLRRTSSPTVFTQQLGRCLAPGNKDVVIFDFVGNRSSLKYISMQTEAVAGATRSAQTPKKSRQIIVFDYASPVVAVLNKIQESLSNRWTPEEDEIIRTYYPSEGKDCIRRLPGRTLAQLNARRLRAHNLPAPSTWTAEEDEYIRAHFPIEGPDCYVGLPGRTRNAVKGHAHYIGLYMNRKWTPERDAIIRAYYPSEGPACAERMDGISRREVFVRAQMLKVNYNDPKKWSPEEDALLLDNYPAGGVKACREVLQNRSDQQIQNRARRLGLRSPLPRSSWTPEEDDIIRAFYPSEGQECASRLPGRTKLNVRDRAGKLKVKSKIHDTWSEADLNILREYYPIEGKFCAARLSNPTLDPDYVAHKARKMGLRRVGLDWTEEEIEIIRKYYPSEGSKCASRLPGRTPSSIVGKAQTMHIQYEDSWTDDELQILRDYYPTEGADCAARLPKRTPVAVTGKASLLGIRSLKLGRIEWTEEQLSILREFYPKEGILCMERLPGLGKARIKNMVSRLGLSHNRFWTEEENQIVREFYPKEGSACAARLTGKNPDAVKSHARTLGIRKESTRWTPDEDALIREFYPHEGADCYKRLQNRTANATKNRATVLGVHRAK